MEACGHTCFAPTFTRQSVEKLLCAYAGLAMRGSSPVFTPSRICIAMGRNSSAPVESPLPRPLHRSVPRGTRYFGLIENRFTPYRQLSLESTRMRAGSGKLERPQSPPAREIARLGERPSDQWLEEPEQKNWLFRYPAQQPLKQTGIATRMPSPATRLTVVHHHRRIGAGYRPTARRCRFPSPRCSSCATINSNTPSSPIA